MRMAEGGAGMFPGELPARAVDQEHGRQEDCFPDHSPDHRPGPRGAPPAFPSQIHSLECLCPHTSRRYRSKSQESLRFNPDVALGNPRATRCDRSVTPHPTIGDNVPATGNGRTSGRIPGGFDSKITLDN